MLKVCHVCGETFDCGSAHKTTTCPECISRGFKYCNSCKRILPVSEFGTLGKGTCKLKPKCKSCYNYYDKVRYNSSASVRQSKIEATTAYCLSRRQEDEEYKSRCTANSRHSKRMRYNNDESYRAKVLAKNHDRRSTNGSLTAEEWHNACEAFGLTCAYCGSECKLTMEHVVPVTKGGPTSADNIIPACQSCNSSKGNKDLIEWYTKQPFYDKHRLENIIKYIKRVATCHNSGNSDNSDNS